MPDAQTIDRGPRPLAVDLDGTLILTDSSIQSAAAAFAQDPLHAAAASLRLVKGRGPAKRAFAALSKPDPAKLAYRGPLLTFLERERKRGRLLYLVSATDQSIVQQVADHLGFFAGARGSDGVFNLKGERKRAWLVGRFPHGFDYAGDSSADIPIWRACGRAHLVGRAVGYADRLRALGVQIAATI
jgi:phosphoglycolate phosphatase-like HAD superfamily hydrolase